MGLFNLLVVLVPSGIAIVISRALLARYCRRQNPSWPFVQAANLGGLAGGFWGVYATLRMDNTGHESLGFMAAVFVGAPVGVVLGTFMGVGIASCFKGPRERRIGATLGALAGMAAGFPLILRVPYPYFDRLENFAVGSVLALSAVAFAVVGAQLGVLTAHLRPGVARLALLAGAAAVVAHVGLLALGSAGKIRDHTRSTWQILREGNVDHLRAYLDRPNTPRDYRKWEKVADAYAEAVPHEALRHHDKSVRLRAAALLAERGDRSVVPALIESLDTSGPRFHGYSLSSRIIGALGASKDPRAVPALLALVGKDTPPNSYSWDAARIAAAIRTLGTFDDPRVVPALSSALGKPGHNGVHSTAAQVLAERGKAGDERVTPALTTAARAAIRKNDTQWTTTVLQALGQVGDEKAVSVLSETLRDQKLPYPVREEARRALLMADPKRARQVQIALIKDIRSLDPAEREARRWITRIAEDVKSDGTPEAWAALREYESWRREAGNWETAAKIHSGSQSERRYAIIALGQIGDERALRTLTAVMRDEKADWSLRRDAARALVQADPKRAEQALIAFLRDIESFDLQSGEASRARAALAGALLSIGTPEAQAAVREYESWQREWRRREAEKRGR